MPLKKWIFLAAALAVGFGISFIPQPDSLTDVIKELKVPFEGNAMAVLGVLAAAIVLWAGQVFHETVTALLMSTMFVVLAGIDIKTSLSAFSGTTMWLLIAAFGLGAAIKECGLLYRISIHLLKLFPLSYRGQVMGLMVVTTVTAPFVPSKAAKTTVLGPLTRGISDVAGYKPHSKPAMGLFNAFYGPTCSSASLFITASVTTFALVGLFSEEIQAEYGFLKWALSALPWFIPLFAMMFFYIAWRFRPTEKSELTADFLAGKIKELGAWTRNEIIMCAIMVVTVVAWSTKEWTALDEWAVAVIALCAALIFGVLPMIKFRTEVAWESLIFIGCAVSLAAVLPAAGINKWLVVILGERSKGIFDNPFLLIIGLAIVMILGRFLILSEIAALTVFMAFFVPLADAAGINPWIIGFILNAFVVVYFLPYQSAVFLSAVYASGEDWVEPRKAARFSFTYTAFALVACFIAYFIWNNVMGIWYV